MVSGWCLVGLWLASGWSLAGFWGCLWWVGKVIFAWIAFVVCLWLISGWSLGLWFLLGVSLAGLRLVPEWSPVGLWLACGWPLVGPWLAFGLSLVGWSLFGLWLMSDCLLFVCGSLCFVFGGSLTGLWLLSGWSPVGLPLVSDGLWFVCVSLVCLWRFPSWCVTSF